MGAIGSLFSAILDIYENVRTTPKKEKNRKYETNSEFNFSGNRRKDLYKVEKTPIIKKRENETKTVEEDSRQAEK